MKTKFLLKTDRDKALKEVLDTVSKDARIVVIKDNYDAFVEEYIRPYTVYLSYQEVKTSKHNLLFPSNTDLDILTLGKPDLIIFADFDFDGGVLNFIYSMSTFGHSIIVFTDEVDLIELKSKIYDYLEGFLDLPLDECDTLLSRIFDYVKLDEINLQSY